MTTISVAITEIWDSRNKNPKMHVKEEIWPKKISGIIRGFSKFVQTKSTYSTLSNLFIQKTSSY